MSEKCPKCGAEHFRRRQLAADALASVMYTCGSTSRETSYGVWAFSEQTDACRIRQRDARIRELEQEVERLVKAEENQ